MDQINLVLVEQNFRSNSFDFTRVSAFTNIKSIFEKRKKKHNNKKQQKKKKTDKKSEKLCAIWI